MNQSQDEAIEALLREQFEGPVFDDGFSDRVVQQLPPRRHRAVWPLWAGVLAGAGASWLGLLSAPLLHAGWQEWISGKPSASAIILVSAIAGMSLLACWWTTMEAEDH
ncbi:MAG TPA: hypothetical protein VN725_10345 [Rhodanobacteraceae bacterium]|nr:hypothetical protein [Rhodanobacteraceae bacterium]